MSMSEFERRLNKMRENDLSALSTHPEEAIPADFSAEDMAFAQELDSLFDIQEEEMPPYYVQTLLDSTESRFQPAENGFEHKTRARVFRRLKLRRCLMDTGRPTLGSLFREIPLRRSLATTIALVLLAFMTVMLTSPSFASGLQILLQGARTGVMQVHKYPNGVKSGSFAKDDASSHSNPIPTISLQAAQAQLHNWPLYWPHHLPDDYTLNNTYLYQSQQQSWADGPFMELDFALSDTQTHGRGLLAIREFKLKPDVSVLQVVMDGAAQPIKIDQNGQAQAIYVDGQWVLRNKIFPVWVYGQRSELIYQKDGIVFWIVGDQRDGIGKEELLKVAASLQVFHVSHALHVGDDAPMNRVLLLNGDVNSPFTGDVIAILPDDNNIGPYLTVVGSQSPAPTVSSPNHSHPPK